MDGSGECSAAGILIMPGAGFNSNKHFFIFTQPFCFPVKIILGETSPSIRHIQVLLPKAGMHCFDVSWGKYQFY